jgi:hypothetical protein
MAVMMESDVMALEFDLDKNVDQNIAVFRKHLEEHDLECAKILFDNWETLLGDGNANLMRANRTAFNETVLEQLKALPPESGPT